MSDSVRALYGGVGARPTDESCQRHHRPRQGHGRVGRGEGQSSTRFGQSGWGIRERTGPPLSTTDGQGAGLVRERGRRMRMTCCVICHRGS